MDKEDVVHTHNGILVCHMKRWNSVTCDNCCSIWMPSVVCHRRKGVGCSSTLEFQNLSPSHQFHTWSDPSCISPLGPLQWPLHPLTAMWLSPCFKSQVPFGLALLFSHQASHKPREDSNIYYVSSCISYQREFPRPPLYRARDWWRVSQWVARSASSALFLNICIHEQSCFSLNLLSASPEKISKAGADYPLFYGGRETWGWMPSTYIILGRFLF